MAEVLVDGEFCLPPQFLTDDDHLLMDKNKSKSNPKNLEDCFGLYEFGFLGFSSDPSSPVESMMGSTETESDEEDYLAGLTRQMTHSSLEHNIRRNDNVFASEKPKGWGSSRSPQSTLRAARRGCGCMQGSSRGSYACQSRVSSPRGAWDLLYAAAGEVARMRVNRESYGGLNGNGGFLGSQARKFSSNGDVSSFYPTPRSLDQRKIHASQILKQPQLIKQQNETIWGGQELQHQHQNYDRNHVVQSRARSSSNNNNNYGTNDTNRKIFKDLIKPRTNRPMGLSCLPLQQQSQTQNGSGMRAVFLGNPTVKRQSAGTGVFLPRVGAPTAETRKKPACSTALLPARVVQALNLNLDEIVSQPELHRRFNPNFTADTDGALKFRSGGNELFGNQKQQRNFRQHQGMAHEVGLPQEWTY